MFSVSLWSEFRECGFDHQIFSCEKWPVFCLKVAESGMCGSSTLLLVHYKKRWSCDLRVSVLLFVCLASTLLLSLVLVWKRLVAGHLRFFVVVGFPFSRA
ncbi:hypothetical protein F2Q69_00062663 [Brassica cretica]|uniref:Uncharacterized protein n=1 Tax=Brassica cretica TaxID=69181 RepID=A0A8S9RHE2_BRACR|nr:hypothetical protein F2Q69_00062663 [Brassica cretica]